jgi:hypothetical protein
LPRPKRLRMGSLAKLPPQKTPHSTPLHEGRCCSCSKQSTCQRGCEYRKSKRQCRNCDCFGQCRNKLDYRAALCHSTHDTIPGNDDSPGPVVIMTNITRQSTQTNDEPTSPSEPRCLVLEEKSKGRSPPAEPTKGEDKPHEREDGDVPGSSLSDADQKMDKVYGDHIHHNPGTHLSGGIADDALWQERWLQLVSFPSHAYDVLNDLVCSISSLLLCNNSVTLIDNTQLSLYFGYKRKVSYSHCSHIQLYKCIRVLCSSGSLCSSSHVHPTHSCGIMLLTSSSVRPSY